MVTVVYNYFSGNFRHVDNNSSVEYERKYRTFSTKDLKKALNKLKLENGGILEIKFVAKKLRILLNKSNNREVHNSDSDASEDIDHDNLIGKNFWGYVKNSPRLAQIKHSIFLVGSQNLLLLKRLLSLTPRPIKRLQTSYVK